MPESLGALREEQALRGKAVRAASKLPAAILQTLGAGPHLRDNGLGGLLYIGLSRPPLGNILGNPKMAGGKPLKAKALWENH